MKRRACAAALTLTLLAGYAAGAWTTDGEELFLDRAALEEVDIGEERVALAGTPALPLLLLPEASGVKTVKNQRATIDYSNIKDGYVMVKFTAKSDRRLRTKVTGPGTEFIYDIKPQEWTTFPLADGNGAYTVKVYEKNPATGKYAVVATASFTAELTDEFAPFLRPNQYVNYASGADNTLAKAEELIGKEENPLSKVEKIYNFVVGHLTYDKELARNVSGTYLPELDKVLEKGTGICFDYAAMMAAMLRSQGIPCKLVTGYVGTGSKPPYHAWISVWTEETGWVDGAIYFDGTAWQRMDPTFASTGNGSETILRYIGDGKNYAEKYFY